MKRRTITIAAVAALATLVTAELAMRLSYFIPVALPSSPYIPDDDIGYRLRPNGFTDADGFNNGTGAGDPAPARRAAPGTVAFVGDSFTFGTYAADGVFPALVATDLAAQGLTVRAVNLGIPSTGPDAYVRVLRSYLPRLRPAAAVVTIYLGNDIAQSDPERLSRLWLGQLIGYRTRDTFSLDPGDLVLLGVFRAVRALAIEYWYARSAPELAPDPVEDGRITPAFSQKNMERVRWLELDAARIRPNAAIARGYDGLSGYLGQMAAAAQANAVPLLVVLAPARVTVDPGVAAQVIAAYGADAREFDYALPARRVGQALAAQGIAFLDLTPVLTEAGPARVYNRGDTHWNRRGNAVVAEAVAEALKPMMELKP